MKNKLIVQETLISICQYETGLPMKWIEIINATGIINDRRYRGTYTHKDIAFKFANRISVEFKQFSIKEFQRLKNVEIENKSLEWNLSRSLSKINRKMHIDATKQYLIPNLFKTKRCFYVCN